MSKLEKEAKENKPDSEKEKKIIDVLCTAHTMVKNRTSTYYETLLYVFEEIIKILNNTPSREEIQRRIREKNAEMLQKAIEQRKTAEIPEKIEVVEVVEVVGKAEKPKRTYSRRKAQTEQTEQTEQSESNNSDNESDNE